MKKRFLILVFFTTFLTTVGWNITQNEKIVNISDLTLANIVALATSESGGDSSCDAGGPGSFSCSISQEYPGGIGSEKSVSCIQGYYACCNKDAWGNLSAFCVKMND